VLEALPEDADALAPDVTPPFEPQWARILAFGTAALVVAFGVVSLTLAVAGIDHSYLVFPLGAVAWIGLLALARPILVAPGASTPRAHLEAALAVVFVGGIVYWHARHASQHVLINRDGGAYTNAGRWIAVHGNLRVVPNVGPFAHQASLIFKSAAITQNHDGSLSFQFAHLLPSLLALAQRIGGDRLMFATPALLAGTALLALWVVAWRLLRYPFVALAAVVAFAFVLPEVSFSRDTYSEIPTQVVLFTALWMLIDRNVLRRPRLALLAGLFLGALQGIRIDALALKLGLPVLFAWAWIRSDEADRPPIVRSAVACGIGLIPGLVIGFTDVILRSHEYFVDLRSNLKLLAALMAASAILSIVAALVARKVRAPSTWSAARTNLVADVIAIGVAAAGLLAWFVRPRLQTMRGAASRFVAGLQGAAHARVNPRRTYFEQSMHWMSWYLGPVVVAAGIVGAALLVRAILRTRQLGGAGLVAMLAPVSAIYLWKARAAPDQIWVMRRFLDSALPLLVLLAFGLVVALLRCVPRRLPRFVPIAVALVIALFAIGYPISTTVHVRAMTEQRGDLAIVKDACKIVGDDGAIIVLHSESGLADNAFPQTLRGWCGVPVATLVTKANVQATLERLAAQWQTQGRHLWALAGNGVTMHDALPSVKAMSTPVASNGFFLERTLLARPEHYTLEQLSFVLAQVPSA
jgi:hypothetical protein